MEVFKNTFSQEIRYVRERSIPHVDDSAGKGTFRNPTFCFPDDG